MKIYNKTTNQFQELYVKAIDNLPIGTIVEYGGSTAPNGFLLCQGQAIPRAEFRELFAVIGTTYGAGDGSTTFNLPDRQGLIAIGAGTHTDTNGDSKTFVLGQEYGEYNHTLTINEMPNHNHNLIGEMYALKANSGSQEFGSGSARSLNIKDILGIGSTGGSQAHNNLPPTTATNFIIKAKKTVVIDTSDVIQETDTASTTNVYSASAVDNKLKTNMVTGQEVATNEYLDGKRVYIKYITGTHQPDTTQLLTGVGILLEDNIYIKRNDTNQWHKTTYLMCNADSNHASPVFQQGSTVSLYIKHSKYINTQFRGTLKYTKDD